MKKLIYIITILALPLHILKAQTQIDQSYFDPPQQPTYIWDIGGSPYEIMDDIEIPKGSNLIIEPNVEVLFQGYFKIDVKGSINAIGTVDDMITITSITGTWKGIRFEFPDAGSTPSKFHYCKISKAEKTGVICLPDPDPESSGGAIYVEGFSDLEICYCELFENSVLSQGGAIGLYNDSDPLISHCNIHDNYALKKGGGICMMRGCDPEISNNTFEENTANFGGGALAIGIIKSGTPCCPEIYYNHFLYNSTEGNGGGIFICSSNPVDFENNTFENNTAVGNGGGIYIQNNSTVNIGGNNNFLGNVSSSNGGGIFIDAGQLIIGSCQFQENNAVNGGGIYQSGSESDIVNCVFNSNTASSNRGAIYTSWSETEIIYCSFDGNTSTANGGGIYMDDPKGSITDVSKINLNSFKLNTAFQGSALYYYRDINDGYHNEVLNNLFVENHSTDKGTIYLQGKHNNTIFNHNTVSDNTSTTFISGICVESDAHFPDIIYQKNFHNNIIYESVVDIVIIQTYTNPTNYLILAGYNYLNRDNTYNPNPVPGFVSSTDYHLTSTSILCIDAGYNNATKTSMDLDGNSRIIDGYVKGYYTDFGYDEYYP